MKKTKKMCPNNLEMIEEEKVEVEDPNEYVVSERKEDIVNSINHD